MKCLPSPDINSLLQRRQECIVYVLSIKLCVNLVNKDKHCLIGLLRLAGNNCVETLYQVIPGVGSTQETSEYSR